MYPYANRASDTAFSSGLLLQSMLTRGKNKAVHFQQLGGVSKSSSQGN